MPFDSKVLAAKLRQADIADAWAQAQDKASPSVMNRDYINRSDEVMYGEAPLQGGIPTESITGLNLSPLDISPKGILAGLSAFGSKIAATKLGAFGAVPLMVGMASNPVGVGATAWHGLHNLTENANSLAVTKYKNALEKARIEQHRSNAFDIDAEKKIISENGDADLSSILSNPKLWDSENEEMTQAGLLAMDDIYTKKAIDNLRLPYIDDVDSLDNANHRAQYEAMKSILDEKRIPYNDTSSAQSKYIEVGGKKIRFADHPNMVKDSAIRGSLPIINVSPTEYKFSDALRHVEGIERDGVTAGKNPLVESDKNLGIYGYK